jgi:hypothetical protein
MPQALQGFRSHTGRIAYNSSGPLRYQSTQQGCLIFWLSTTAISTGVNRHAVAQVTQCRLDELLLARSPTQVKIEGEIADGIVATSIRQTLRQRIGHQNQFHAPTAKPMHSSLAQPTSCR